MAPRAPLINLKDIRLQDGVKPLFEGVTFSLEPRVRACLVGRNGAGKSTLLKLAAGWVEPDSGERTISPGARIAFVPQEPLVEGATLRDYATSGGAETYVAESELWEVGMDPDRPAAGLSGGEIRRAALAKAFAEDPDLLLLDEPTNHLDIIAIEALQTKIKGTRAAVLSISHDRAFLEAITGRCLWLWSRKVRVRDEGFAGFDAWMEAEMAAEAESLRRLEKAIERETYTFYRSITAQRTRNEGRARNLNAMRLDKAERVRDLPRQLEMAMETGANSGKLICDVKKVSKAFGERVILKDFSLRLLRGDRLAIVGPNGAGKSTLLKILLGELAPDSGEVKLGANLTPAYLDQTRQSLNDAETLWEALAPSGDQVMVRGTPKHVAAYAKDFLFSEAQLRQPVSTLSGGERNRLQLARAIAKPANVMVLDEPTNDLDMDTLDLLEAMLADYDGTLILVSHDRDFVDRLATSTLALNGRGEAAESPGGYSDFIRQNPDFFTGPKPASVKKASASTVKPEPKKAVKLTYKEQRRLEELAQLVDSLPLKILATENKLHAPNFYAKDPNGFAKMTKALEQLKAELEACELEWLELEDKRAQLAN